MSEPAFDSILLRKCLDRWRGGDRTAIDDLLRAVGTRLEKLSRRMTQSFPNVRSVADSADVLQSSLIRLLRTLQVLRPPTTRDFFNLAAVHIRRELLDLARRCKKRKPHVPLVTTDDSNRHPGAPAPPAAMPAADFDLWVRFHQAVDALPSEEREVVGLVFYHGWTQAQIAELFGVDERTVRRRWSHACQSLRELIGGDVPPE